ncbi:glycosyltransferase [bacterium]|nr:glycosyltransferase [bacterium]
MDLSIVIVNYNVKYFLEQALLSLMKSTQGYETQFIVVDNASQDGSVEFMRNKFPAVELIANETNLGFGKATNQGLKVAAGRYILVINPDTLVGEEALRKLIEFMDTHPEIGAVGPKLIDRGGKFELNSRRGFPTPTAAFCKITGLAHIFPNNRFTAGYNLTYLDPDVPSEVDSLSGAFMLIRREVYEQTGGFDEDFFMYGEDLDWCWRIKQKDWKIWYLPDAKVIHYGGESSLRSDVDTRRMFYDAMFLFIKKHYSGAFPLKNILLRIGVSLTASASRIKNLITRFRAPMIDLLIVNTGLFAGRLVKFGRLDLNDVFVPYLIYNIGWLAIFASFGIYSHRKTSIKLALIGAIAGSVFSSAFTYFFKQYAYSRFVLLSASMFIIIFTPLWRWIVFRLPSAGGLKEWFRRRTLLVGVDELTGRIAAKAQKDASFDFNIIGFIDPTGEKIGGEYHDREVLGAPEELPRLVKSLAIEEVIFSAGSMKYEDILKHISLLGGRVGFKVIPESALQSPNGEAPFLELGFQKKPRLLPRIRKLSGDIR